MHMHELKGTVDHVSALSIIAVMAEWLPVAVSALALVWYCIRIYEYISCKIKDRKPPL